MIRAILFDLDGTLIDSSQDIADGVNTALRAVGLPERSQAEITTFIGGGARQLLERAIAPRIDLLDRAFQVWEPTYRAGLLRHTAFYPGMRALVDTAASKLAGGLAVHTNKPGDMARAILEGLGAARRFVRILGSGDGSPRKPSPEGAKLLLDALGVSPAEAVYVGDSDVDFATAAAAGIPFRGCGWGYDGDGALHARGVPLAKDASELLAMLALG